MLATPEGLAQDRDVSLTREHQTVLICISLYDVKGSPKTAASDWTAKHSGVLGDLIGGALVSGLAVPSIAMQSTARPASFTLQKTWWSLGGSNS